MGALRVLTAAEQVGEHLRAELSRGAWGGRMPGGSRLAVELGVGRDTVEAALRLLEQLGMLVPQGEGRRRRIVLPDGKAARPLRVAILDIDPQSVALADASLLIPLVFAHAVDALFDAQPASPSHLLVAGDVRPSGRGSVRR